MEYRDLNNQEAIDYKKNYEKILNFTKSICELHCENVVYHLNTYDDTLELDIFYNKRDKELSTRNSQGTEIHVASYNLGYTLKMLDRKYVNLYFIDNYINDETPQNVNQLKNFIRNIKLDSLNSNNNIDSDNYKLQLASNQCLFEKFITKCSLRDSYNLELFHEYFKEFYKCHKPEIDEIALELADEFHSKSWVIN